MSTIGEVLSINISSRRGEKKVPIKEAIINKYGIEGDGHSGKWHRQVSLLSYERIQETNKSGLNANPGDFAENLTTKGIDLKKLKIGDTIIIGKKDNIASLSKLWRANKFKKGTLENLNYLKNYKDEVILEVTQIGKKHLEPDRMQYLLGLPKEGIFCRVLKPGKIKTGDNILAVK